MTLKYYLQNQHLVTILLKCNRVHSLLLDYTLELDVLKAGPPSTRVMKSLLSIFDTAVFQFSEVRSRAVRTGHHK